MGRLSSVLAAQYHDCNVLLLFARGRFEALRSRCLVVVVCRLLFFVAILVRCETAARTLGSHPGTSRKAGCTVQSVGGVVAHMTVGWDVPLSV